MVLTGFNAGQVNNSISRVQAAYDAIAQALSTGSGQQVVTQMADKWVCQEAIDFFTQYKSSLDKMVEEADLVFESVVNAMNSAASSWAERTGNAGAYSARSLNTRGERVKIDAIQENINDTRGIDIESAGTTFTTAFENVLSTLTQATTAAQNAVESCGFLGGSQAASLSGALGQIKSNMMMAFNNIKESFTQAMGTTLTNYGSLESSVSTAFNGNITVADGNSTTTININDLSIDNVIESGENKQSTDIFKGIERDNGIVGGGNHKLPDDQIIK